MQVPRFHKPRWADVCDECHEDECICGKRALLMGQGCECSRNRDQIIEFLKEFLIEKPERFKGIFQEGHKPCGSCTKYVYDSLKAEKARRSLTRPRPGTVCQIESKLALSMPNSDTSPSSIEDHVEDNTGQVTRPCRKTFSELGHRSIVKQNHVKGIEMIKPVKNESAAQQTTKTTSNKPVTVRLADMLLESFDTLDRSKHGIDQHDGGAFVNSLCQHAVFPPQTPGRRLAKGRFQHSQLEQHHHDRTDPPQGISITTLMLCGIPCRIRREDVIAALDSEGFAGKYDFVHVPGAASSLGYAFINFVDSEAASSFSTQFTGYRFAGTNSAKVCSVKAACFQGLQANSQKMSRSNAVAAGPESNQVVTLSLECASTCTMSKQRRNDADQLQIYQWGPSSGTALPSPLPNPAYLGTLSCTWLPFVHYRPSPFLCYPPMI